MTKQNQTPLITLEAIDFFDNSDRGRLSIGHNTWNRLTIAKMQNNIGALTEECKAIRFFNHSERGRFIDRAQHIKIDEQYQWYKIM